MIVRILIILSFLPLVLSAQEEKFSRYEKNLLYEAEIYFFQEEYDYALQLYEELHSAHPNHADINYRLGASLFHFYPRRMECTPFLEKAVKADITEAFFYLGLQYHQEEKFDRAYKLLDAYRTKADRLLSAKDIDRYLHMIQNAERLMSQPVMVDIQPAGTAINSDGPDYAPLLNADGSRMYFTSRRDNPAFPQRDASDRPYEDIYFSDYADGTWTTAQPLPAPVNSAFHDATAGVSQNGEALLIYRSNRLENGGDLHIVEQRADGSWSEPQRLSEKVNGSAVEASASYSGDGSILYFSSNRPGGFGGKDIYRVQKLPNGRWSQPQNLGPVVNTPFDEDAPYVSPDGKLLYFSSNGHNTMGGYDVFLTREMDQNFWSFPENLGYPINTVQDDIHFTVCSDGRAFFSSSRRSGIGDLDIYEIVFGRNERPSLVVRGKVAGPQGEPVGNARITVRNPETEEIQGIYRSAAGNGKFILALKANQNYRITVEAEGFAVSTTERSFTEETSKNPQQHQLELLLSKY